MPFLAAIGAVVVGSVSTVVLLTGALLGWIWVNEKLKKPALEPTLPLVLLIVLGLTGWILNATTGDAGVFGLLLGIAAWVALVYHFQNRQKPKSEWEQFVSWVKQKRNS